MGADRDRGREGTHTRHDSVRRVVQRCRRSTAAAGRAVVAAVQSLVCFVVLLFRKRSDIQGSNSHIG